MSFDKSLIRVSSIPVPSKLFSFGCMDWGTCGLAAIGAKGSVLIYKANLDEFCYLRSVEFSNSNITCLKFHDEFPLLAIAEETGRNFLLDCEQGSVKSITRQLTENNYLIDMKWSNGILVGLTNNSLMIAIDFWPFEPENGAKNSRIIWQAEISGFHAHFSLDPFHKFRCLLSSGSSFQILNSTSSKSVPSKVVTQTLKENQVIQDSQFHPHIPNLILVAIHCEIVAVDLLTKTIHSVIRDDLNSNPFHLIVPSYANSLEIAVIHSDFSLSVYQSTNHISYQKIGQVKMKRENFELSSKGTHVSCCSNPLFPNLFLFYNQLNGFYEIKTMNKKVYVSNQINIIPIQQTCFDFIEPFIAIGNISGEIILINTITAIVQMKFKASNNPITLIKLLKNDACVYATKSESGVINFVTKQVNQYDKRLGTSTNIIALEDIAIFLRGKFYIGIVHKAIEKPIVFTIPIVDVAIQVGSTPATSFIKDSPNIAVLLKTGEIQIYSISIQQSQSPVLRLRCSKETAYATALAWKGDCIVTSDSTGVLVFYDFAFETSRNVSSSLINIQRIEFEQGSSGLYVHSSDNKLGFCINSVDICPMNVTGFSIIGNGLLLIESSDKTLKILTNKDWKSVKRISSPEILIALQPSLIRLKNISEVLQQKSIQNPIESAHSASILSANYGFPLDSIVWATVARYFGGPPLPLKFSFYGGLTEIQIITEIRARLFRQDDNISSSLLSILYYLRLKDFRSVKELLQRISEKPEYTVIATIAAVFINQAEGEMDQSSTDLLITTAVPLFANKKYIDGCILMYLAHADLMASRYLQDNGIWDDSVECAKLSSGNPKTIKELIRRAAHHYLDDGEHRKALLLFASIGDFHPVLSILSSIKMKALAFHLMMFLDQLDKVHQYEEDTSRYITQFADLDTLRNSIILKYEKMVSVGV